MKKLPFIFFALGLLASFSWAMEKKPDPKIAELKERCDALSEETGKPYEGVSGIQIYNKLHPPMPCGFPPAGGYEGKYACSDNSEDFVYQIQLKNSAGSVSDVFMLNSGMLKLDRAKQLFQKGTLYGVCAYYNKKTGRYTGAIDTLESMN